ncbi:Putative uncharacterized protein OS=Rhodopirellula baltica (strain SH1) GN=RB4470 PE=4 SV=1 [Gemmataceae bacterium]|nr:Putative uncharacterized protein OS=Rhodopirellula baltica (strain SH1) GN=RB4470 PE=4 SV=1 [Gemmataceae bacterium]VTT99658.1 Putative uncharacterized protein OS=Rhodopirellula baltica (strain SH1) GN=RB4470 PE=4 SV=1 [Gemmataceae bacterium]
MRVTRYILPVAFLVGGTLSLVAAAARAEDKKGAKSLEGTYTLVSGEEDGKAVPEERIKGGIVRFTADKITGTDKDKKEFFAANYTLDTTKTPWAIAMKSTAPKAGDAPGLVKKDGDTLTIVYALPGGEAPKEFKAGPKQHLFVLKAAKTEK